MTTILLICAFGAGFLLVFAVNFAMGDFREAQRLQTRQKLAKVSRVRQLERARHSLQFQKLYEQAAEEMEQTKTSTSFGQRVFDMVEESGVRSTPGRLIATSILLGLLCGLLGGFAVKSILIGLLCTALGGGCPILLVLAARHRRRERMLAQLPDAFDLMARSLRAGQTMSQAMLSVATEFSAPLSDELLCCYEQQNLGLSTEAALRDLARRSGLLEIKIFVLAVVVHRQCGGNLSELLARLAKMIRERIRIRGMIGALTAEGRMQACILLALPPLMLGAILMLNRTYAMTLFQYPMLLVVTAISMAMGAYWMNRIVHFDF